MTSYQGLSAALETITEEELAELRRVGRDGQLALLPLDGLDFDPEAETFAPTKRGPGRPKGALNKSTEWWRNYIIGRFGSPLEALAQIYARPVAVLKAELGCTGLEAVKLQLEAASRLAPYVHQKLPVQVDLGDQGLVNLVINVASERAIGRQTSGFTIDVEPLAEPVAQPVAVENENPDKSEA